MTLLRAGNGLEVSLNSNDYLEVHDPDEARTFYVEPEELPEILDGEVPDKVSVEYW